MFDVAASLQNGLATADARLRLAQNALARANAGGGPAGDAMARAAQAAIFDQALLSAVHARLAEIKAATK